MTTEDMFEEILNKALKAYKKNSKGSINARKLDRHESIEIEGITFACWREYVVYRMAQYIKDFIPNANIDVYLEGNDSRVEFDCTEEEQRVLNNKMYVFIKEIEK